MLDCYLKKVTFRIFSDLHLSFYGDRRLTLIQPIHDLDNRRFRIDCGQCFFFNMKDEKDSHKLYSVSEFVDVFHKELKHLRPYGEIILPYNYIYAHIH